MAIKVYNPTTPARRGMSSQDFSAITAKKPLRGLLKIKKGSVGRNNSGRITTRHRGGGHRRFYRLLNHRLPDGVKLMVEHIEYDPNRSARIARVKDDSGKYHYILAEAGMKQGAIIQTGEKSSVENGNRLPLRAIPAGSTIYAIELQPGRGGQVVRAAGTRAQLMAKEGDYALVRLPSGEIRRFRLECRAHLGSVGNEQHQNVKIGSAGRKRHMGIRPTVRGVVQNAVDHPHGGGDGGRHGTGKAPRTPWGQLTLGYRTRPRGKINKLIVRSRHEAKRKR
ncbi:MAG: 50S ribosomal protein L2 [Candidatus Chaera renei]|uniref:Large ribosomal subunit protein uL2 n=1 Tax=Candidatus Chaera renei TaxID=2506947 RepID=A0A4Q0AJ41_9BACT|nr:MAG: 50S ribosomal protein L2 [Candidatus Chaera renei]